MKPTTSATTTPKPSGRAVLVTTAHRGVFFGYLIGEAAKEKLALERLRNITYWDAACRGFVGLASTGPTKACRVGPPAGSESTIFDITGVFGCTEEAVARFEEGPWSK